MPLIGAAFEHRVRHKAANLAILCAKVMCDDAIFLNCFRRNRGVGSALTARRAAKRDAALALFVVIGAFHHVVTATGSNAIDRGAAARAAGLHLWDRSSYEIDEVIGIPRLERHIFPNAPVNQS